MTDPTSPLTPGDPLRTPPTSEQEQPPPPPPGGGGAAPPPRAKRLTRSSDDRVIAGVAGGLGRYFGVDPIVFRIAFAVAVLAGGAGILAYIAAALFVPSDDAAPGADRSAMAIIGAVVLAFAAFIVFAPLLPILIPLGLLAAIGVLLWRAVAGSDAGAGKVVGQILLVMLGLFVAGVVGVGVAFAAAFGGGWVIASLVITAGVLLIAGAFFGGARWLILPALVLAIPLGVVSAAGLDVDGGIGERDYRPATTADVRDGYDLGIGQMTVDLRDLDLPPGSTEVDVELGMGEAIVLVPRDACVSAAADIGAGHVNVLGRENGGLDLDVTERWLPDADAPQLLIDAQIGAGSLEVRYDDVRFENGPFSDSDFGPTGFRDHAVVRQVACA